MPLAQTLARSGYAVAGSTTTPEKLARLAQHHVTPYLIDLQQPGLLSPETLAFFAADVLVIAIPPKRNADNPYAQQISNLHQALLQTEIKKIIFISSTGVYVPSTALITEESPVEAAAENQLLQAENLLASPQNPWQTTIVRFAGLFGPGREPGRFLAGKTNLPDPGAPVNLIHLADCIALIRQFIDQENVSGIFNACADAHPSRQEFYVKAARKLNLPEPQFEEELQPGKAVKLISNAKIKAALAYSFRFPDPLLALDPENAIVSG